MVITDIDGEPRETPETYRVQVPVPPRDWDRILLRSVTAAAVVVTALSIVWSTASIGDLLGTATVAVIAYGAAAVFDSAWIACLIIEWLERYDQSRAAVARKAGYVALAVAVLAIGVHGWKTGDLATAGVGAAVSVIAKGLWVVVMRHFAVPLGEGVESWLFQRRQEITAERALSGELRRMHADQAYTRAVYGPTATLAHDLSHAAAAPEIAQHAAAPAPQSAAPAERSEPADLLAAELAGMTPSRAIRVMNAARPELTLAQLAEVLQQYGQEVTEVDVAIVLDRRVPRPSDFTAPPADARPHHVEAPAPHHLVITVQQPEPIAPAPNSAEQPEATADDALMPAGQTMGAAAQTGLGDTASVERIVDDALADAGASKADAVRAVREVLPASVSAGEIARHLARHKIDADAAYVRTVNSRDRQPKKKPEPGTGQYL
ncbi:hypothetical protein ACFXKX_23925 [Streptomyces scopuliridis]|uniref:hypothetical protein n=1 Tax=Streptomyces scopuliridis TaxID=452529 RepID=UPI003699EC8C